jgi:hypothetical protein
MCTLRLQASTLSSLLCVHPETTATHSFISTVCASLNYSHPLMYYCICTNYRHILFYHYCMCTLRLQPSTLVSILHVYPWTTDIHSCIIRTTGTYSFIITVCASSDYSHPLLHQYCMCILELRPSTHVSLLYVHSQTTPIHSCINTAYASSDYNHLFFCHHCMCILRLQPSILLPLLYISIVKHHTNLKPWNMHYVPCNPTSKGK